jgi:SAM-dependent methyltransferase
MRATLVALGGLLASIVFASVQADPREDCVRTYKPETGQAGKDVVWVPTNDGLVERMLTMAKVGSSDLVYDLGAGDGKIAIAAARKFGARAVGVEYNPDMAKLAQCMARAEGVSDRVRIVQGDIFETDFSDATVVTLYLLPELNLRLRPTILKMKPGTRVVSHSFLMDDWEPDERSMTDDGQAYLWIVPAQVAGSWTFQRDGDRKDRFEAKLEQKFQEVTGAVGKEALANADLHGDAIKFSFSDQSGPAEVEGRVIGDKIEANVKRGGKSSRYTGTRT